MTALLLAGVLAAPASSASEPALDYRVVAGPGGHELAVEARIAPGQGDRFEIERGLGPFLDAAEYRIGGGWRAAARHDDVLVAPGCADGCRLRYRVRLRDAALELRDRERALAHGEALLAPPSSWLVRPEYRAIRGRYRMRVETPEGVRFVTGVFPSASGTRERAWEGRSVDLAHAPYSGFGRFEAERVAAEGGEIEVAIAPGERRLEREAIRRWVERSASAVAAYYGRFPVPRLLVVVLPGGRRPVGFGTTLGNGGASIMIWLGRSADEGDLRQDWVLVHEMVHLALPNLPRTQRWLEEGLATYVEPIARSRAGLVGPVEVWRGFVRGMPNGLPRRGEQGLDHSPRWGTTYWGGALFCLLADVEIRERTGNRRSLDDALRGIVAEGGSIAVDWPLQRVLEAGDRATGLSVLGDLYQRMGRAAAPVDLAELWRRLGIEAGEAGLRFEPDAPLARARLAIAAGSDAAAAAPDDGR